jgi:hypothetical protein
MLALEAWVDAQAPLAADMTKRTARILTVRTDGTGYRELYSAVIPTQTSDNMRWTPDSRALVFATMNVTQAGVTPGRVMRIPVGGGELEFDGLDFNALAGPVPLPRSWFGPANIDLSANGSYVAFSGLTLPTWELWVLENVVAALNKK